MGYDTKCKCDVVPLHMLLCLYEGRVHDYCLPWLVYWTSACCCVVLLLHRAHWCDVAGVVDFCLIVSSCAALCWVMVLTHGCSLLTFTCRYHAELV